MKWKSRLYNHCFCFERNGVVYTSVNGDRKSTSMKWKNDNKDLALKIAEQRFRDQYETKKTIADLQNFYNEVHIKKLKPSRKSYTLSALKHLLKKNFRLNDIIGIRTHILNNVKTSDLSQNTLSGYIGVVQHFFKVAVENDFIEKNPITRSMKIKSKYKTEFFLSPEQLELVISNLKQDDMKELVRFISLTGLRINEVLQIKDKDIFEDHFIIHGKGGRDRIFPLDAIPEVREYLKEYNINYYTALGRLKSAFKKSNIHSYKLGFHIIRKFAINNYIRNGLSVNIASEIFGHKIAIMEKHYLEAMDSKNLNEITKKQLFTTQ